MSRTAKEKCHLCAKLSTVEAKQRHRTEGNARRQGHIFLKLNELLEPFEISRFNTYGLGAYKRHLDTHKHVVGKQHPQRIESKHIMRTRTKRLVRRTICFSKTEKMHDIVIGLFVNCYAFGVAG
jgi:insertion element IS1 protein InsB